MPKINMWQYLQYYQEDEYELETGKSPYTDELLLDFTYDYIRWVRDANMSILGNVTDADLFEWYTKEIANKPAKRKGAPEISDMLSRVINVYFIKEYKFFFNKHNKKSSTDYVLNVDKVIIDKLIEPPLVFNNVQTFIINYEIKKLLDKAIMIANEKYDNIVYISLEITSASIMNVINHLEKTYTDCGFNYVLLDKDDEFGEILKTCDNLTIVKTLF